MLIGRDAEQEAIARLIAGAKVGQSGVLVLSGEAGIGKTALLEHALDHATDMRVLRAGGSETERNVAFAGLLQLVRPALGLLDKIPPPQADALAVALALRNGTMGDRFAAGAAALSLISRFAEERPLLLLVDDAHALDRPSAEALVFVGRRLMADPVALVITTRQEPASPVFESDLPQLPLPGLALASAQALLARHAHAAVPASTVALLHRATDGNPLAITELAGEVDALGRVSPHTPLPVPEAVARSFTRRVADLPETTQRALLLAAIADGDLSLMARAADALDTDAAHLEEAEDAGFILVSAHRVEFRHPLVRSSVYAAASPGLRRRAHAAVGHALPAGDQDRRAWHLCESVVGLDDEIADSMQRVARRARDRSAHDVAATAFERSALITSDDRRRAERFLAAGESAWYAGQIERAGSLLAQASRLAEDAVLVCDIDGVRGNIALRSGSLEDARDILADAAEVIAPVDPDRAILLLADLVMAFFYLADTTSAVEASTTIDELLARSSTDVARIRGDLTVGMAQVLAGRPGIDRIRSAVASVSSSTGWTDDPRRAAWEALGPLFLRESGTGRDLIRRTVEDLRDRGALVRLPTVLFYAARDEATTDRWQSAASRYQEAIGLARETGETTDLVVCLAGLSWLQARMGRADECRTNAQEAIRLGVQHHVHLARVWATFAQGDLELALGRPAAAAEHYEALLDMLSRIGVLDVDLSPGPELAEALARVGRLDEAREVAVAYHAQAVTKGQPWAMARGERALAVTSEVDDEEQHFDAALTLHQSSLDAFEEGRTRLAYGAALRRRRRRVAARPDLRTALETFERLGAQPWADLAAGELQASGEAPVRRGENPIDQLTPQEYQIARMLAAGRTTRQAASALFLSPKTVEYHLRHVYMKLGIHSRVELAVAVGDESTSG